MCYIRYIYRKIGIKYVLFFLSIHIILYMKKMRPHHFTFLAYLPAILFVIFGFLAGIFYSSSISHFIAREIPSDLIGNKNISYIDPGVDTQKKPIKYVPFELKTSKRIFEEIKIDKTISLSVYVRNLDNG